MKATFNILSISIICLILSASFTSCGDDDGDTVPPVINLIEPEEGGELLIGAEIHFDMELSDNQMLLSYKVEIHNNFNGHGHSEATKSVGEEVVAFFFQRSWDVSGQKNAKIHHHDIIIPENTIPGDYHLIVYCTDAAGNESHVARNIVLSHNGEVHEH